jgi:hypothetical protein
MLAPPFLDQMSRNAVLYNGQASLQGSLPQFFVDGRECPAARRQRRSFFESYRDRLLSAIADKLDRNVPFGLT